MMDEIYSNLGRHANSNCLFSIESFLNYFNTSRKSSLSNVIRYASVAAMHEADLTAALAYSIRSALSPK